MEIKKYQPNNLPKTLIDLLNQKYGHEKHFDYFLNDYEKSFSFCLNNPNIFFQPIGLYTEGQLLGHIALIIDSRLSPKEAFFGFLETPDNEQAFSLLWQALKQEAEAKGLSVLRGPVNGNIWHQYRCIKTTDGSEFFKAELFCEPFYYNLLNENKPTAEINYYSASRENFNEILKILKPSYDKLIPESFTIKEGQNIGLNELQTLASLSRTVFQKSWGFTDLNQEEFLKLYSTDKLDRHLSKLYLLYKNETIVGFCMTLKENETTLICKTICLLPEYHGMGLGNALAFKLHYDAQEQGIKKMIYALIREGNQVKNFPKDDVKVFRQYAAFEFKI